MLRTVIAAAIATLIAFGPVSAGTIGSFTDFVVFGDSLSDPGNLERLLLERTGERIPSPVAVNGRFSNGPVWSEHVAGDFARRNRFTENLAFIGANAAADGPANPSFGGLQSLIPSVEAQVALFAQRRPSLGHRPIASLLGGANDLFFGGIGSPDVVAVASNAAHAVADSALALRAIGFRDVLLWQLPDPGRTPAYALFEPELTADASLGTAIFNDTLRRRIAGLRAAGLEVETIDLGRFFNQLLADPQRFNVSDVTLPCVFPSIGAAAVFGQAAQTCSPSVAEERAFWSDVHPNAVIHEGIAGLVRDRVAPVPLPVPALLLLAGIAGLGAVRCSRSRGA